MCYILIRVLYTFYLIVLFSILASEVMIRNHLADIPQVNSFDLLFKINHKLHFNADVNHFFICRSQAWLLLKTLLQVVL